MMNPRQSRLYILFASSVFFLLVSFSVIVYATTSSSIHYQLKLKSDHILTHELKEHFIPKKNGLHLSLENDIQDHSNQIYFITKNKKIIKQSDYDHPLIKQINAALAYDDEFQHRYMNLNDAHYFVSGKKVSLFNHEVVYIYTVFESTESYHGLTQLKDILIGLTLIYIFLILLMTYFFSKKAMAPLEYAVKRQKQFVQDASHELKTPLAVVKAGTEVIEQFDGDALSDVSKEVITDIQAELTHMNRLVTDLLSLTRLDKNMEKREINLSLLLTERIAYFEKTYRMVVNCRIANNVIIQGNEQALKQAITILFDNAAKYVNDPIITIDLTPRKLIFKDNGPGVAPSDLPHLFERFYRGDSLTEGSGIGLSLFKEIMDQHNARTTVENDHGLKYTIIF